MCVCSWSWNASFQPTESGAYSLVLISQIKSSFSSFKFSWFCDQNKCPHFSFCFIIPRIYSLAIVFRTLSDVATLALCLVNLIVSVFWGLNLWLYLLVICRVTGYSEPFCFIFFSFSGWDIVLQLFANRQLWSFYWVFLLLVLVPTSPYPQFNTLLSKTLHTSPIAQKPGVWLNSIMHSPVLGTNSRCIWVYFTGNRQCSLTFNCSLTTWRVICWALHVLADLAAVKWHIITEVHLDEKGWNSIPLPEWQLKLRVGPSDFNIWSIVCGCVMSDSLRPVGDLQAPLSMESSWQEY